MLNFLIHRIKRAEIKKDIHHWSFTLFFYIPLHKHFFQAGKKKRISFQNVKRTINKIRPAASLTFKAVRLDLLEYKRKFSKDLSWHEIWLPLYYKYE